MINLEGRNVFYTILYSKRARHLRLRVSMTTGLEVIIPEDFNLSLLEQYIKSREGWILDKLDHYHRLLADWRQRSPKEQQALFLGLDYNLIKVIRTGASPEIKLDEQRMFITLPDSSDKTLARVLENWYRQKAREILTERVTAINRRLNLKYNRIFIRNQKTRWGSCSGLKNLSFNWRLVMAPLQVIDYLVVHELAHLMEMNHSGKFWQIVENFCPDYKIHRKWLKDNGFKLTF